MLRLPYHHRFSPEYFLKVFAILAQIPDRN
jgi:hypothetical protein